MRIDHIHIRNFRKLKNCRIDLNKEQTIFVGANNSGKTSAMSAIIWFLKDQNRFTTREFTLTNWRDINELANNWVTVDDEAENRDALLASLLSPEQWDNLVPSLDLLLAIKKYVPHRLAMDSLAQVTLGIGKTAEGLQALKWYKEGKLLQIAEYCCYDVKITRLLHEYGAKHGRLYYQERSGKIMAVPADWKL